MFDDRREMRLILLQRRAHGLDLAGQIGLADRDDLSVQRVDIGGDGFSDLDLAVGLVGIIAKQKILFGPAALQQLDLDLAVQFEDRARVFGRVAVNRHRGFTVQMDAADQDDADHADDADRRDFMG